MINNRSFFTVGCSGYCYLVWKGAFYPVDVNASTMLDYYGQHFSSMEINSTYYGMLETETMKRWIGQVPPGFVFSMKAPRSFIESQPGGEMELLWERIMLMTEPLKRHQAMGAMLFQLPATRERDLNWLQAVSELAKDEGLDASFEFRHPSWFVPDVMALLERFGHDVTTLSLKEHEPCLETPGRIKYFRFCGVKRVGNHDYTFRELLAWKERILAFQEKVDRVYIYFNNHAKGCAPLNARTLFRRILGFVPDEERS